jgi:hypothetical protein
MAKVSDTIQGSASMAAWGALAGGLLGSISGLFIGLGNITIPSLGIVAAGGPMAATLLGASVGVATGGLVGALVDAGAPPDEQVAATEQEMNNVE